MSIIQHIVTDWNFLSHMRNVKLVKNELWYNKINTKEEPIEKKLNWHCQIWKDLPFPTSESSVTALCYDILF